MAYQSLYRRYRPRRFAELRGQEHVVRALRNAVAEDRVGHAYLFSGPRGTGKTTSARILAKALNCAAPVAGEPCCECDSCLAVEAGTSFDVHELDAASNRGIDDIRQLIEKANLGTPGRTKVYILDEVHMLTKEANAALLKTLEEPPAHVVFVLATTDPQKVPDTIRSRSQHLEFHLLPADVLEQHVRWVISDAALDVPDEAVEAVVQLGKGSARDTLSALDQVVAAGGVVPDSEPLDELVEALIAGDTARALAAVAAAVQSGRDARTLTEHLVAHLRDAFLSLMAPELVQLPDRIAVRVADQARRLGPAATVRAMEVLGETLVDIRHAPDTRLLLDVALVRLTNTSADVSPGALLARIERIERTMASGAVGGTMASGTMASGAAGGPTHPPDPASAPGAPTSRSVPPPARDERPPPEAPGRRDRLLPVPPREQITARSPSPPDRPTPARGEQPAPAAGPGPRAALGARARRADPAPTSPSPAAAAPPAAPPAAAPRSAAAPPAAPPAAAAPRPPAGPATDGVPSRELLTLAWVDQIVPRLRPLVKAYVLVGRFVESDGATAVFALPNDAHRAKCEPLRGEVEAALEAHFGRSVPLRFVVDSGQTAGDAGGSRDPDPSDDDIDLTELVDAPPPGARDPLEHLQSHFPGAELLDEE
jgi:DNA polymerase-3 subunit gamma/tau